MPWIKACISHCVHCRQMVSELTQSLQTSEKELEETVKEKSELSKENKKLLEKVEQLRQEVTMKEVAVKEVKKQQEENERVVSKLKDELSQAIEDKVKVEESLVQETVKATAVQKSQDKELEKKQDELIQMQEQKKHHIEEIRKEKVFVEEKLQKVTNIFGQLGQRITEMGESEMEKMNTQRMQVEKRLQEFEERIERQVHGIHQQKDQWVKRRRDDELKHQSKIVEMEQSQHIVEESRDAFKAEVEKLQTENIGLKKEIGILKKVYTSQKAIVGIW